MLQYPEPAVDGGRYPVKRCVGDEVRFSVDIFRDGHELLRAVVRYRAPGSRRWQEARLQRIDAHLDGVRWAGTFTVDQPGVWRYDVEAWTDRFGTWRDELERKFLAGQTDLGGELSEGGRLLRESAEATATKAARAVIEDAIASIEDASLGHACAARRPWTRRCTRSSRARNRGPTRRAAAVAAARAARRA